MNAVRLREHWERIPTKVVEITQWDTPEAQRFWMGVRDLMAQGQSLDEIGEAIGVRLLEARYNNYGQ